MKLRARHRRQVVEEILDIEIFSKMNLLFREKQKNQDEIIKQSDFNCQLIDSKIESQKKHIEDMIGNNQQLIDKKQIVIKQAQTDIDNYQLDKDRVTTEKTALQSKILDETKINNKNKQIKNLKAKLKKTYNKHCLSNISLGNLPNGKKMYKILVSSSLSLKNISIKNIHMYGLKEVNRIEIEMNKIKKHYNFKGNLKDFFKQVK